MNDDYRDKMERWMGLWDKHAEQFAKDHSEEMAKRTHQQNSSFFTNAPPSDLWKDRDEIKDDDGWGDLIQRSSEFDYRDDQVLTEEDGFRKLIRGATPGSDKVSFQQNPQRPWAVGKDQEGEDGPRVTDNWTDGNDLKELDKIKRAVESMERKVLEAEVRGNKGSLATELKSLRKRMETLSEKIQPRVDLDVT